MNFWIQFFSRFFTTALGLLITYCTYKDYVAIKDTNSKKFYSIFSLYTNGKSLINLKQPESAITSINGLKALSMPLIVLFHAIQITMVNNGALKSEENQIIKHRIFLVLGILPTETFFVISGFLSVKSFIQTK